VLSRRKGVNEQVEAVANYVCNVAIVEGPLDSHAPSSIEGAGAIVEFFGNVRPRENGELIEGLEYEAHRSLAEHQLEQVAQEAATRFALRAVKLHHRIGFVPAGESSLYLRVAAEHRGAAFDASKWIVDELKKRVPIWKTPRFMIKRTEENRAAAIAARG
jgi:molybdopterin synthase catalytic subunit